MKDSNIIFLKGIDRTLEIQKCYLQDEKLYVIFKSNPDKFYTYTESNFEILPNAKQSYIFRYLYALSHIVGVKADDDIAFLAKEYDKIRYIPKDSALFVYLNPSESNITLSCNSTILAPFGINISQYKSIQNALNNQISIIEGPPGTGKTQTILNIIANLLYQGKTICVLSNNNAAIQNVYDKLSKYGFDYLCAILGNMDNKDKFIDNQNTTYPTMDIDPINSNQLEQVIQQYHQKLYEFFVLQNNIATDKEILKSLQLEYEYFKRQEYNPILPKIRKIFSPTLNKILMLKIILEESEGRISLWQKLKAIYLYGIGDFAFFAMSKIDILRAIENLYYTLNISILEKKIQDSTQILNTLNAQDILQALQDCSLLLLKDYLKKRYENGSRKKFTHQDLCFNPKDFLQEYPIIFSTTHSISSSLGSFSDFPLFDYAIIDEASQVDIVSGALSLICAKNAVIVGDKKQLPNVIENETKIKVKHLDTKIPESYRYTKHSILSSISATLNFIPKTLLKEHYRCNPKIIGFCNKKFYNNELIILSKDTVKNDIIKAYITPQGNHARGLYNQREIDVIENEILPELRNQFDKSEIGIISPYRKQNQYLQNTLKDIEIDTIHKYQGREKEAIVLTTTANNINDFINDAKILNVAISRAKSALRIVTSAQIVQSDNNISDFIKYIQYQNFEVAESKVKSIFDLLYKANMQARLEYLKNKKRISQFDSENLALHTIQKCLNSYDTLDVLAHIPLFKILRDTDLLDENEKKYALNPNTHIDFVIYNKMNKILVCTIEIDGFAFHNKLTKQFQRDKTKNSILQKYEIPLLRLSTIGSNEERKIEEFLRILM